MRWTFHASNFKQKPEKPTEIQCVFFEVEAETWEACYFKAEAQLESGWRIWCHHKTISEVMES